MSAQLYGPVLPPGGARLEWLNDSSDFQMNFVHGLRNLAGLHVQYEYADGVVSGELAARADLVGFPGQLHGGLIGAVLDDAMGRLGALSGKWYLTGEFAVRFHSPVEVGQVVRVEAWATRWDRRLLATRARALAGDVEVATATGTYLPVPREAGKRMVGAWPGFARYLEDDGRQ